MQSAEPGSGPPTAGRMTLVDEIEEAMQQWRNVTEEMEHFEVAAERAKRSIPGLRTQIKQQQHAMKRAAAKFEKLLAAPEEAEDSLTQEELKTLASTLTSLGGRCAWVGRWRTITHCHELHYLNKEFSRGPRAPVPAGKDWMELKKQPLRLKPIKVDAVVDDGTWLKFIVTSQEKVERYLSLTNNIGERKDEGDVGGSGMDSNSESDELVNFDFVWAVQDVIQAARWNHCRHIHIVLPGMEKARSKAVDDLLVRLQREGGDDVSITFSCRNSDFLTQPPLEPNLAIPNLLKRTSSIDDQCKVPTSTVNLDPSILLALASDLSHGPVDRQLPELRHIILKTQETTLKSEDGSNVRDNLVSMVFPALRGRGLVCTRWAATYFLKVIGSIATHSEEARGQIILRQGADSAQVRQELQQWSSVPIPDDLCLPIRVVDDVDVDEVNTMIQAGRLPPMASGVAEALSPLNRSVYLYGWAHRCTTLSAHRGISRQIDLAVSTYWTPESEYGPDIAYMRIAGFLLHRDKYQNWRELFPDDADKLPPELSRWNNGWMTWGRGISTYGLPDSKTWEGVGHPEQTRFSRLDKRTKIN